MSECLFCRKYKCHTKKPIIEIDLRGLVTEQKELQPATLEEGGGGGGEQ